MARWPTNSMDVLNFMASQDSQIFNTMELLGMEKIHDKLIRIGVAPFNIIVNKTM